MELLKKDCKSNEVRKEAFMIYRLQFSVKVDETERQGLWYDLILPDHEGNT